MPPRGGETIIRCASRPGVRTALCLIVLAAILCLLFHEALFRGKGLVPADGVLASLPWAKAPHPAPANELLGDQFAGFVPHRQFVHDRLRRWDFPLWNPHIGCGVPSVASIQWAALYPINLVLAPVPPFVASGIAALLKLWLAGAFTVLYLRRLGASHGAALLAGVTYALSGFMIVWLGHPHVNCAVLLPLLLYLIERQFGRPWGLGTWAGFAVAFGAMLLGGHPPTAVHITLAVALYFGLRVLSRPREAPLRRTLLLAAAMAGGVLVAAPQVFTFLEYYRESSSALSTATLERWSSHLSPNTLIHFLLPLVAGSPSRGFEDLPAHLGLGALANFNERTAYVGVLALFLALVAVVRRRDALTLFYVGLTGLALIVVHGVPPVPSIVRVLPIVQGIDHRRLLLLVDWSVAILAGLGLDTLIRLDPRRRPRALAAGFAAGVTIVLLVVAGVAARGFARLDAPARAFVLAQAWPLAGGILLSAVVTLRRVPAPLLSVLCVAWTALDLLWFAAGYNPAIPADRYYPTTDSIRFLQRDPSPARILGVSTIPILLPNTAEVYGLYDARGQDFMTLRRYEELITGGAGDFSFYQFSEALPPALALLDVKYLLAPEPWPAAPAGYELVYRGEIAIYRHRRPRERALTVFEYRVERDPAALLAEVRSGRFDPARTLLLEEEPRLAASPPDPTVGEARARVLTYEPDEITVEALMPRPGFLLLLDNYFPGWRAYRGDQPLPIYRADYTFRAVALPAGRSTVRFVYRPASFRVGVVVSLATLAGLAVVWIGGRRRVRGA